MDSPPPEDRLWHEALGSETLLLVDHHPVFAEVLALSIVQLARPARVELAHDVRSALAKAAALRPGVVLLDSHLGSENGLDLLPEIAARRADTSTIMLSESRRPEDVATAFARGARGWVSKLGPVDDLLAAIRAVQQGDQFLAPPVVGPVMDLLADLLGRPAPAPTFLENITPREREVLDCLVEGLSRQETATRLYLSPNTVRTHVQSLLRAAEVHSTLALVAAARHAQQQTRRPFD